MLATQVFALAMGFRVLVCEKLHTVLEFGGPANVGWK